jgi:phosphomannomutase
MKFDSVIFREYDIRGVYQKQFDVEFAYLLGRAVVTYITKSCGVQKPKFTIGNDARHSGPALVKALSEGIRASGGNVTLLGLVTSPISYFSTFELPGIDGSIMVTGSHNPPEYNGFKVSIGRSTIFGKEIKALEEIILNNNFLSGTGTEDSFDIRPQYVKRYQNEFKNIRPISVVLDCGNGAAGSVARSLYESTGLKPHILFEEPDGRFPNHHPDPTIKENLVALAKTVRETKSLVGIGFDGDADRIGVVDDTGEMLYGDELLALFSRFVLAKKPAQKIIGDVKCSDRLFDYIKKYGGEPIMWKTGHSLIKEKIKVEKAPFGGELSGHIFFADRNYGYDDALYAGLRVVEILSETGKKIRDILSDFPPAFNTPEIRIDTTEEKKVLIVEALRKKFSASSDNQATPSSNEYTVNEIDGVRISFQDGWALARASNTQPVLVLRFESHTVAGLERIRNTIESIVKPLL